MDGEENKVEEQKADATAPETTNNAGETAEETKAEATAANAEGEKKEGEASAENGGTANAEGEGAAGGAEANGEGGAGAMDGEIDGASQKKDESAVQEAQEEVFDFSQDQRMQQMIAHLTESLENFKEDEHWKDEHYVRLNDFLTESRQSVLFFWNDFDEMTLRVSNVAPPDFYENPPKNPTDYQVAYFLKRRSDIPITAANLTDCVTFKSIGMDPLEDLLEKMNSEYVKKLLQDNDWPDGVKKEFIANLHKFMAFLNETTHAARGQTYLYIPEEDLSDIEVAAKDKDLLQRLESTVIYWTRQIKELVSNQDSPTNQAIESPLDEIAYWHRRTANLVVLTQRLQKQELKKIIKVLEHASSSYLPGFQDLEKKIQAGHDEAQDNLQFLNTLSEPCRKIEQAKPKDIPKILPEALNCVRIIWELSKYYNTPERMKGLLTKISNQIIKRCRAKIDKNDMLEGDVEKCMADLEESIDCCRQWKVICQQQQYMIKKYSSRKNWDLDTDETIFAENEAFIQRCKDLMEICEGQLQFARKGEKQVMPYFGGTKGPEYTDNLYELERKFVQYLERIKELDYDILDVKITKWHDDYSHLFKDQSKSLEVMYQNIIGLAFKNVSTVQDAVEMLENFDSLAKRPLVKEYVQKKAADMVYKLFKEEIKEVEETFDGHDKAGKGPPPMPFSHPQYGGLAIWARSLIVRIDNAKSAIDGLYFIPEHAQAKDALDTYQKLKTALDNFIAQTCFNNWNEEINSLESSHIDNKLEQPVLIRSENNEKELPASIASNPLFTRSKKSGFLESNFDCDLHKIMIEVQYWTKIQTMGFVSIDHKVMRLLARKEQLRILRENVMLIVRDYNTIIHTINDKERSLFKEHLDILDRTIEPGIRRHHWGAPADNFVYACRKECQDVFLNVKKFQNNVMKIMAEFEKISTTTLTNVQKKLYLLSEFIRQQEDTLKVREEDLIGSFEKISRKVMKTYDLFIHRGPKIQGEWLKFMYRLDDSLERSLKQSVKNTLLDLGKHIIGDKQRQELVPIFRVYTILDPSNANWKIVHDPAHEELRINIKQFMAKIIHVTRVVPMIEVVFRQKRDLKIAAIKKELDESEKSGGNTAAAFQKAGMRPDVNYQNLSEEEKEIQWKARWDLPKEPQNRESYERRIEGNKKIKNKIIEIDEGIENIHSSMEEDRKHWQASEELRQLYNIRTDKGKRRILRGAQGALDQDPVQRYKESIESLIDLMNEVKNKQPQKPEKFIILDCSKLKNSLTEYGTDFIQKIFQHLIKESKEELTGLLDEFKSTIDELKTQPSKLQHLKKNKDLYNEVKAKMHILDAKRDPIKKKFQYIQEQDQDIGLTELSDEDKAKLDGLDDAWEKFKEGLEEANTIIQKAFSQLKTEVDNSIEDFKKDCQDNKKNFQMQAPYSVEKGFDNSKAREKLQEFKGLTDELREREEAMKFGLEIFDIEVMAYPEVTLVEKEIRQLDDIWIIKSDWDNQWDQWKEIGIKDLDLTAMDYEAIEYQKRYAGLDREVRDWPVWMFIKSEIEKFRKTIPLIIDLRDDAMRERHWKELRYEVKVDFDETSEDFNLEKIFSLNLLNHEEKINDLAENARKQLKIEIALKEIKTAWEDDPVTDLDIDKQVSKAGDNEEFYYIRSTDNIMALIEDHGVKLGGMKSSPYYKEFDTKIDYWEGNIAQITETLEILIAVQGKWKYLESIFRGQADIAKQLPNEDSIFKRIHQQFKVEMERIAKERNCLRSLIVKGFLPLLVDLNKKFEQIQKNLNDLLEAKRGQFPRFYFLSNDDLLEIIGQSKDPYPILAHIGKIFEGVNSLNINQIGGGRNTKNYEIDQLISPEKESVEIKPFPVEAKVENWLKKLIDHMKEALRSKFYRYFAEHANVKKAYEREKLLKVIKATTGQVLITTSQMQWTQEVEAALISVDMNNGVAALKKCRQNFKKKVESYIELVEKPNLEKLHRLKLVALIIIDEHNREIIEKLFQQRVSSPRDFEWLQQLRFKKANLEENDQQMYIACHQTNCVFDYGYEYQGNNGRLVVTPLTDRCYMTLTNALNMQRGGAPQGPAGTGKTETVKDLGKNLAFFVVIQNCSDQMDIVSLGRIFAGLALSGAWGCFDEFNRILLDVLSVVAQQVLTILDAIRKNESSTAFGELNIHVQKDTGLFITMNPGYAGRSELPDNLACLFRPVAMMAPDFNAIAKITLMSEGFKTNDVLAKKVVTVYELMKKQLSKQDHYDFGMRAVKSVLNASGRIKRERPDCDETTVIIKAIRDMNLPKFIAEDVILFDNLFIDLFPDCEEPENSNDDLQIAIEESLMRKNLQLNENLVVKIMQLYESKVTRHGNMLVGLTMSGKTKCWEILMDALNQLNAEEKEKGVKPEDMKYQAVKEEIINPKAINENELFGYLDDQNPPQWSDGILSNVLKRICLEKVEQRWMILDGPVDTLWIESMNSVLDDNKLLTLTNGDRIGLSANVRLLFEVENLAVASPATVSRAGMIYMDLDELGWEPYITMWIKQKESEELREQLNEFVDKYLLKVLKVKRTLCKELVATSESACVINMCKLFDALSKNIQRSPDEEAEAYKMYVEKWFVFCLIWSIGATVEEKSRRDIDYVLRDIDNMFPHANTVYEHFLNLEKKDWAPWEEKLKANWKPASKEFSSIIVPTVDTVRNRTIVQALLDHGSQVLIVGNSGVGKTVLVDGILLTLDGNTNHFTINFSAGTTSNNTQEIIESNFERRAKNKYRPKNAKQKAVCFIDDLNMPRKDTFGSQPPLELIRQWIDYEFWYDRQKIVQNNIQDLQILSAMGKPGGGRAEISPRITSKFHVINYTIPSESNMKRIFETIALLKLQVFDEEDIKTLPEPLAVSTINLFNIIQEQFLPTPAKTHYVFNMRDISKVFQGVYQADKNFYENKEHIMKLWAHEILRVFHDRLNSFEDREKFKTHLNEQLENTFQMNYAEHCTTNGEDALYVDFLNDMDRQVYEEVTDFQKLREHLNSSLESYNMQAKLVSMDLVLFKDAIIHITRIYRILNLKRGHAFLVGVGGSGRHSLTRLSAYISKMNVFQLEITKGFNLKAFREFLKVMYEMAAFRGRDKLKTVFIFSDNDVVQESFLEDIQNMLNGGVVPNLYNAEDLQKIRDEIRTPFKKSGNAIETPDAMNEFFFNRIKDNLHLSICMSPIGQAFRDYCRMYPALINNTTIDWFMGWPADALQEVAMKFIGETDLDDSLKQGLSDLCAYTHTTTTDNAAQMKAELGRIFYVTPTNYIELLKGYKQILIDKRTLVDNQRTKLRNGLSKLDEARVQVEKMSVESEAKRAEVSNQQKFAEDLMMDIAKERKNADEQTTIIEAQRVKIGKEKEETEKLAADAENELKQAEPALMAAQAALEKLDKKYIAEIKAFNNPPADVQIVMSAVMIVLGKETSWASVKKELTDSNFVKKIMEFDKDNVNQATLKKIEKFTKQDNFKPAYVERISIAAGALCMWVISIEDYSKVLKVVAPKRQRKAMAEEQLRKKVEFLAELEASYKELADKLADLQAKFDKTNAEMEAFKAELESLQIKIDRGDKLITGLSGEKTRWEATLIDLDEQYEKLIGDCMLAAAFMSYCGPFPSEYRDGLIATWIATVEMKSIPFTKGFDFSDFMAGAAQARQWQINGLPTDKFSTENGVFVTKGLRWALNIDPQTQAMNWIKKTYDDQLTIADSKDPLFLKKIEQGCIYGKQVLFLDVGEELDPVLDNVLNKSVKKVGRDYYVRIGDNEVEFNPKFKLYITTRMQNPHYTPEVSTKVTVVNFTVKQSGLEEQCLGIVVKAEQPSLENTKNEVIAKIATNKNTIIELEDTILRMLSESKVNLLEDVALIDTLQSSKETSDEVKTALEQAEITVKRINETREMYRACGKQASILFFVLNDLSKIDPMYQFSLDWYKNLFMDSIEKSREQMFQDRIKTITKFHTTQVYKVVCKSLFEKHKLLLSMQMCVRLQMAEGVINEDEWNFFLKGGQVLNKDNQPDKPPFEWITNQAWDNITELERLLPEPFNGISAAVGLNNKEWHRWFLSVKPQPPESAQLPGEWETKCDSKLQKMIILRCFRPDRVNFAIRNYVEFYMKKEFIENRPSNLRDTLENSTNSEPIIFVLSQGADPTDALKKLADDNKVQFEAISMGKGQAEKAKKILTEGAEAGNWIFLANCHLSIALLPELESIIDMLFSEKNISKISKEFKLILSARPHPQFSISLLQRSLKIAQEPPKGIKANMLRLYGAKTEFTEVDQSRAFRKAVFGLCWFHTVVIERKKFKSLGWNVSYAFNDSDYQVCEDLLAIYMGRTMDGKFVDDNYDKKSEIPWEAITYLIASANYGGRITDDRDRRLIQVYAKEIFNNNLIALDRWRPYGTDDYNYVYSADEANIKHPDPSQVFTPDFFYEQIATTMEDLDPPVAYGQHINAEITSQILDSNELLDSILTLTPQKTGGDSGGDAGGPVKKLVELQEKLPEFIDLYALKHKLKHDDNPLNVVLTQEIQRYNVLLRVLAKDLKQLELGVKGLVLISPELEEVLGFIVDNKVPKAWSFCYFSLKSLSNWFTDLGERYDFFREWAVKGIPFTFWIGSFTYPTGFTTSLLQKFSRKATGGAPIDKLEFDFQPVPKEPNEINEHPKDGAFITKLSLEGAKWNPEKLCLMEPDVMELTCPMPVLHFKPIQKRSKPPQNMYVCPCYYYPKREGTVSLDSFMLNIDIKSGDYPAEFWIKRGTALLMSLG